MTSPKRKLLIVLDLNGTLIDRLSKGPERVLANRNPLCPKEPDTTLNRNKVFLRPYLDVFLQFLLDNFHVSAWTSATPKNSGPLVDFIFEPFGGAKPLEFVWDREKCIIEPTPEKEYNSVKDLTKIWLDNSEGEDAANPKGLWNEHNTILVDDSACKSCRTPLNHLLVPTFSVGDTKLTRNCDEDTCLLSTVSYLKAMLEAHAFAESKNCEWSVQTYMKETPLYIESGNDNAVYLRNEHIVSPTREMYINRHRSGPERELLGEIATIPPFDSANNKRWPAKKQWEPRSPGWKQKANGQIPRETENGDQMEGVVANGVVDDGVAADRINGEEEREVGGSAKKIKKKKSKGKKKRAENMMSQDEGEVAAGQQKETEASEQHQRKKRESSISDAE
ncbi:hypothetical protein BCR33DRAFT_763631, partial [Rhizoclosmatium globosum]